MAKIPKRLRWVLLVRDSDFSWKSKLIALVLSTHMNPDGYCYLREETLSMETSLNARTLRRYWTDSPELDGWLKRTPGGRGKGGRGYATEYQALIPERGAHNPPLQARKGGSQTVKGGSQTAKGGHTTPPTGLELDTEPEDRCRRCRAPVDGYYLQGGHYVCKTCFEEAG